MSTIQYTQKNDIPERWDPGHLQVAPRVSGGTPHTLIFYKIN